MGEEDLLGRGVDVAGTACWLLGIAVVYFRCLDGFRLNIFDIGLCWWVSGNFVPGRTL